MNKKPGRKSSASLTVVPPSAFTPRRRIEPPADMPEDQAELWRGIVGALPVDWFDGSELLLKLYCQHIACSHVVYRELEKFEDADLHNAAALNKYAKLNRLFCAETSSMLTLATKMRLTQQSRYGARGAARAVDNAPRGKNPWE